jgi:hypothetical protein
MNDTKMQVATAPPTVTNPMLRPALGMVYDISQVFTADTL